MSAEHERTKPELPIRPPRPHSQGVMRTLSLAAVAVTVAALALTACGPAQGPAGKVVDKDRYYMGKVWHYRLTTQDANGQRHKFAVLRSDYNACYRGSSYPGCANS